MLEVGIPAITDRRYRESRSVSEGRELCTISPERDIRAYWFAASITRIGVIWGGAWFQSSGT